jgi:DNA-binding beta-propeller fold protein YncE
MEDSKMKFQQSTILSKTFFCLIILFIGLMSASVTHAEIYTPVAIWGTSGTENGQFNYPSDIAIDSLGNVYVTDTNNNRIQKFDSSGTYITHWRSQDQFGSLSGIAVDSSGNVYVTDKFNDCIQKFNSIDGGLTYNLVAKWGSHGSGNNQFSWPIAAAVDSLGNVYVADYDNYRIQKFDSSGTYLTKLDSSWGMFWSPADIAVDSSDNVYTLDDDLPYIQKFDSCGAFIMQMGSPGAGKEEFGVPRSVAVDSCGNIYVADSGLIKKFDSSGTYITAWGSSGRDDGSLIGAYDIAIDSLDNVYVVDMGGNCIQKFALDSAQTIQEMTTTVQSLVDSDTINSGQGNSLITKLNKANDYLNAGDEKKTTSELNAFINEVKSDINNGVLSPSEGKALIAEANDVINALKTKS